MDLLRNFAFPYFSRDIAEFWRRWHISLSTWFRDYLYIPLGGSKGGNWMRIRNTFIIFVVSGFWHGANWTFIAWGALNALFIMPSIIMKTNRTNLDIVAQGKFFPSIKEIFQITFTFSLAVFAWVFFRAEDIHHAFFFIKNIFTESLFAFPYLKENGTGVLIFPKVIILLVGIFMVVEWIGRENEFAIQKLGLKWWSPIRFLMYYLMMYLIYVYAGKEQQFIYFQF